MARIVPIRCPECGAQTNMDYDRKRCFCTYCGTELLFEDGSRTINYNATYRTIDEARITESDNQKEMFLRQYEEQHKYSKTRLIVSAIIIVAWVFSLIALLSFGADYGGRTGNPALNPYLIIAILDVIFGLKMITQFFKNK